MAEIIIKPKAFTKEWFGYVWDYYKSHILIGIAVVIFTVSLIVQSLTEIKYDTSINFVATTTLLSETAQKITIACAENSDDLNKNGRVDVGLNQLDFTEANRQNTEMHTALLNKLAALFVAHDEPLFIVDSYMLNEITKMEYSADIFHKADEWADLDSHIEGNYAVSLAESEILRSINLDSSDLFVLVGRCDEEEGFNPKEENAVKIAKFLLK